MAIASKIFTVVDSQYSHKLFSSLAKLREENRFIDIKLKVEDQELFAHKIVLSANSLFFNKMFDDAFLESKKDSVDLLHETSFVVMSSILDYMYSGKLSIALEEVGLLLRNFDYFYMEVAKAECEKVLLADVNKDNCLDLLILSDDLSLAGLREESGTQVKKHFPEICCSLDLKQLTKTQFESIMTMVKDFWPDNTYKAITSWIKHDETNRKAHLQSLLSKFVAVENLKEELTVRHVPEYILKDPFLMNAPGGSQWVLEQFFGYKKSFLYLFRESGEYWGYAFEVEGKSLSQLGQRPMLDALAMIKYNDSIYAVGGQKNDTPSDLALKYDTKSKQWTEFNLNVGKTRCGVCTLDDKMFLVGGWMDFGQKSCSNYDFETGVLRKIPEMECPRWSPAVAVFNSSIYALGGCISDYEDSSIVERYDPREGTWSQAGSITLETSCTSALVADSIYVMEQDSGKMVHFDPRSLNSYPVKEGKSGCIASVDGNMYHAHDKGIEKFDVNAEEWESLFMNAFNGPILIA